MVKVAIVGGDAREIFLAKELAEMGFSVRVFGLPVEGGNIIASTDLVEALGGVQAVILPAPGVNAQGEIYSAFFDKPIILSRDILSRLPKGTLIFVGVARPFLKELAVQLGLELIELLDLDEVAVLNSIPSAEGAIKIAIEKLPITIHGSHSFVLGFGRTGITLARMLVSLGARTTVIARNPAQRARAFEMNCHAYDFSSLPDLIGKADVIFNTVPAFVINESLLQKVSPQVLIIDLASAPGGTDFEAAKKSGINAVLCPGLPGKVAPKTAGRILARIIPRLIAEKLV